MIVKKYSGLPLGQAKLQLTVPFCDYLSKLNDEQKIKAGVDIVLAFKKSIPEAYRNFTDPPIKAGLQKIAAAKGGDVQAYVENAMK